jgi:hypothetical protein
MIVIRENDIQTRVWKDPLVDIHIHEFQQCAGRVDRLGDFLSDDRKRETEETAEHLCEMSRDLIYRANRVTTSQVAKMIEALKAAADKFESSDNSQFITPTAQQYIAHIRKRIELLDKRLI